MAWEAQDIHGRLRRRVGGSSEDTVRTFWAGTEDLLGSGIRGESEVGLESWQICGWAPCLGRGVPDPEAREG